MSSASAAKAKRGVVSLQGPRPLPLDVSPPRPSKRPRVVVVNGGAEDGDVAGAPAAGPVIVYEHTPKVIHARPDEFKALVQRLTGRGGDQEEAVLRPADTTAQEEATATAGGGDPLVLTLGQQVPPPPPLFDERLPSSPGGGGAGGFLLSPGSFLFSPATMQAIQELIS